jgi:hypothetical protein
MEKIDQNKKRKTQQAINFIEELAWLFDAKKNIDLKELPLTLRNILENNSSIPVSAKYESPNPNKNYLIGILPNLFQDVDLFKTNSDLSDFAESILKIEINRSEKRSRYELIGLIVCEVVNLDESKLTNLVDSLASITGSKEKLKQFKEAKKRANFSWNDAIQQLSNK